MVKARKKSGREQDHFGKKAKAQGYPARSVYKLEEIDRRTGLLQKGMHVLDLGAAPGSWTLYTSKKVGPHGHVLAIDLKALTIPAMPNVDTIQADIIELPWRKQFEAHRFDVVLSDMAPDTTGSKNLDHFRSVELVLNALKISSALLKPQGSFVAKIFQGPDFDDCYMQVKQRFKRTRIIRPEAVRKQSVEVFIYASTVKTPA